MSVVGKKLKVFPVGTLITPQLIAQLSKCKLRVRINADMSRDEANDAVDTAVEEYLTCLRNKGRKTPDEKKLVPS